jgi:hypothetical protein
MVYIKRIFTVQILLIFLFILSSQLKAQPEIKLTSEIQLTVNDSDLPLTHGWNDSMVDVISKVKIYYKIVGVSRIKSTVTTILQIPQILSLNDVYKQIVLYYKLLPDEDSREIEILLIHPYFESTDTEPALKCHYISEGQFIIEFEHWNRVPIPEQPNVEDKDIYNQILQISFNNVQSFGDISDDVFEKVADKNKRSVEQVKEIYQKTILWQLGSQIYFH